MSKDDESMAALGVDEDARWQAICRMSDEIARKDEAPTPLESALCGAVWRAKQCLHDLSHSEHVPSGGEPTTPEAQELLKARMLALDWIEGGYLNNDELDCICRAFLELASSQSATHGKEP